MKLCKRNNEEFNGALTATMVGKGEENGLIGGRNIQ